MTDNPAEAGHLEVIQVVYLSQQPLLTESLVSEVKFEDVFPPVTATTVQGSGLELLQSVEEVIVGGGAGQLEEGHCDHHLAENHRTFWNSYLSSVSPDFSVLTEIRLGATSV